MRARNGSLLWIVALAMTFAGSVAAQVPYLVRDIDTTPIGSHPRDFVALDDTTVLFVADDGDHGRELWASEVAPGTARQVRDIQPGRGNSNPVLGTAVDGRMFFTAITPGIGRELWVSDGTETGTALVRDLVPGTGTPSPSHFVGHESLLFFRARTPGHGDELWISDGTADGTRMVLDIVPGAGSSAASPALSHPSGLYFTADDEIHGRELWLSDGTAAGTALLADLTPGPLGSWPQHITAFGPWVCFAADQDLWCTDGTGAGTARVHPLGEGTVLEMTAVGDRLFVATGETPTSSELWVSDGTAAGTVSLRDDLDRLRSLTAAGDRLFFLATTPATGSELWISDGTAAGTRLVRDIRAGPSSASGSTIFALGERVVFVADDGVHGRELWTSDGSEAGTVLVVDLSPGAAGSALDELALANGRIWFAFDQPGAGRVPWISDGTAAGTMALGRLAPELTRGSMPEELVPLGGDHWLFIAEDGMHGREPWVTDGTVAGTRLLRDIMPGDFPSIILGADLVVLGDRGYFAATDGVHGRELWTTDGTAAGTRLLRDIEPNGNGLVSGLTVAGDQLYFFAIRDQRKSLWRSDGSEEGTVEVARIGGDVCTLTPFDGGVAFIVGDLENQGLWRSDGTPEGTFRIRQLPLLCPFPEVRTYLRAIDGMLYFDVYDPEPGGVQTGLWRSDGTEAGTVPISEDPDLVVVGPAVAVGDRIAFPASDPVHGREPWVTDGTAAGTELLADARPGPIGSGPLFLGSLGSEAFFAAGTGTLGTELWATDGTPAGTRLFADLEPGPPGSRPEPGVLGDGRLYFSAVRAESARELWVTDGRAAGTRMVADLLPGPFSSIGDDAIFAHRDRRLFFTAHDGVHGEELWALDTLCFFGGRPLYLHDGRFRVDACWRDARDRIGVGTGVALTDEAGAFSFFNPDNLDLGLKVIDGRRVNGKYWFFFASLTDVAGKVRVTDTESGRYRDFELLPGQSHSFAAVTGFPEEQPISAPLPPVASAPPPVPSDGGCGDGSGELCVQDGRFRVRVAWETANGQGIGRASRTGANSGTFYFFRPDNVELMIKVHDGRPRNGHFWVFFGALSNVRYTVTVTDLLTGAERAYDSPRGRYTSVADTRAFAD